MDIYIHVMCRLQVPKSAQEFSVPSTFIWPKEAWAEKFSAVVVQLQALALLGQLCMLACLQGNLHVKI